MKESEKILSWAAGHGGYVSSGEAGSIGCSRRILAELTEQGRLERVQRGLYALPDEWPDDLYALHRRFPRGVFRGETALDLFGLAERGHLLPEMAFPRGYNLTNAKKARVEAVCENAAVFGDGAETVETMFGNPVVAYRPERTLCELARKDGDAQVESFAFRAYFSSPRFAGTERSKELGRFARIFKVEEKIETYRKALLC